MAVSLKPSRKKMLRQEADRQAREASEQARLRDVSAAAGIAERLHDLRAQLADIPSKVVEAEREADELASRVAEVEGADWAAARRRAALRGRWVAALGSIDNLRAAAVELAEAIEMVGAEGEQLKARGYRLAKFDPAAREADRVLGLRAQALQRKRMSLPTEGAYDDWCEEIGEIVEALDASRDRAEQAALRGRLADRGVIAFGDGRWGMAIAGEIGDER